MQGGENKWPAYTILKKHEILRLGVNKNKK
jgi:hypothetical protein